MQHQLLKKRCNWLLHCLQLAIVAAWACHAERGVATSHAAHPPAAIRASHANPSGKEYIEATRRLSGSQNNRKPNQTAQADSVPAVTVRSSAVVTVNSSSMSRVEPEALRSPTSMKGSGLGKHQPLLAKRYLDKSLVYMGDRARVRHFMHKLMSGEAVSMGASQTAGCSFWVLPVMSGLNLHYALLQLCYSRALPDRGLIQGFQHSRIARWLQSMRITARCTGDARLLNMTAATFLDFCLLGVSGGWRERDIRSWSKPDWDDRLVCQVGRLGERHLPKCGSSAEECGSSRNVLIVHVNLRPMACSRRHRPCLGPPICRPSMHMRPVKLNRLA